MEAEVKQVLDKISELKKKANDDWAEIIATKMGKEPQTIRAYSRGERGVRRGRVIEVLEHLTVLVQEKRERIEKLIA